MWFDSSLENTALFKFNNIDETKIEDSGINNLVKAKWPSMVELALGMLSKN